MVQFKSSTAFNFLFFFIVCNALPVTAFSRTFKNAYISFEMLDNWKCTLEQTEWVCRSEDPQEAKEAVIILTAKEKGPTDTFPIYDSHMSSPIVRPTKVGGTMTSNIIYKATKLKVNDQEWLDSLHGNSEVQNYLTRYLATIKDQIAILVTFSAHNKYYSKHSANFAKTVNSLRVVASKDLLSRPDTGPLRGSGQTLGDGIGQAFPAGMLDSDGEPKSSKGGIFKNKAVLGFLAILLAVLLYIILKVYQNKK